VTEQVGVRLELGQIPPLCQTAVRISLRLDRRFALQARQSHAANGTENVIYSDRQALNLQRIAPDNNKPYRRAA
jgi:hypothetical protein